MADRLSFQLPREFVTDTKINWPNRKIESTDAILGLLFSQKYRKEKDHAYLDSQKTGQHDCIQDMGPFRLPNDIDNYKISKCLHWQQRQLIDSLIPSGMESLRA